jgi:hypothetical protein
MKIVFALLLVIPLNSLAGTFYDGNKLNQWGQGWQRAVENRASDTDYVDAGYFHGFVIGTSDAFDGALFCTPENAKAGQLLAVTNKYIGEHPERWSERASWLVISALKAAFPCAKRH